MFLKTFADIEAYAIRMRKRGDTYREIRKFLSSQWPNVQEVEAAIQKVRKLEKERLLVIEPGKRTYSIRNLVIGGIVACLGVFLATSLWNRGWISTVPLFMIAAGLFGMTKK
jgi:hypothetical protein